MQPLNSSKPTRARKTVGGRERCSIYLPSEEIPFIDAIAKRTQRSRSSVIMDFYYAGKAAQQPVSTN